MSQQKPITKLREKARAEVKKIVVLTNLNDIVSKLLKLMRNHIGEENKISHNNLFKAVYGMAVNDVSPLQEWMMWEMIRRSMHRMRQRTYCFVVSKSYPVTSSSKFGIWNYWVAKDGGDYIIYRDNINRNIRAMKRMCDKCDKAVRLEYWKKEWKIK